MEINELKDLLKEDGVEEKGLFGNSNIKLSIVLNSGATMEIISYSDVDNEKAFVFNIELPYEVNNFVHPEQLSEKFTEFLCEKYDMSWEHDSEFMTEMSNFEGNGSYYDYNGITEDLKILERNKENAKFFDDFSEFMKDKIFICPALPINTDDGSDDTTLYDEGKWAYAKLVPIEKIISIIDFNGGIKQDNKISNTRRPKM